MWNEKPPFLALKSANQDGPALEIVGRSGHSSLIVGMFKAKALGVTGAIEADESGDDAFDVSALLHLLFEVVGLSIGNGLTRVEGVIGDEDPSPAIRFGLWVTALVPKWTADTLFREEAIVPTVGRA